MTQMIRHILTVMSKDDAQETSDSCCSSLVLYDANIIIDASYFVLLTEVKVEYFVFQCPK